MKIQSLLFGVLACVPGWILAQNSVADPELPVPAVLYRSVFADTPTGVEMQSVDWKAANAEVGQFKNGHVDILKWEEAQAKQKAGGVPVPMPILAPVPAPSGAPLKP